MERRTVWLTMVTCSVLACDGGASARATDRATAQAADSAARARQDSINRAQPGYVIDSALTVDEELRRFRAQIGGAPVSQLQHASPSIEALVARFARAVESRDTAAFREMGVTAREYADLIYPDSPNTRPPYRQAVGFVWFQVQSGSSVGLTRLLLRRGGQPLRVAAHDCAQPPEAQGRNRIWSGCQLRVIASDGSETKERLFASIIERDGRFKFVSFANSY
jgi:hypothetical protein